MMCREIIWIFLLLGGVGAQGGWGGVEMEIFDLVEEVEGTFYEYMDLDPKCTTAEVRKAYRRLSLVLHPDKNSAEDASFKFRLLAGIYEVLKDSEKREIYDRVLVEGLPSWKNPVFYYRRVRKMGLAEGLFYLLVIVTVCQYFVNWAAYWEKKFTLESNKSLKRFKNLPPDEYIIGPRPTFYDTLPFQLFRALIYSGRNAHRLPLIVYEIYSEKQRLKKEEEDRIREEKEIIERKEKEKKERKEQKAKRKRVYKEEAPDEVKEVTKHVEAEKIFQQPSNALQIWTDNDLARLAKLMKKYPGGIQDRWEKIAEIMERFPWEVTKMAQKVKGRGYCVPLPQSNKTTPKFNEEIKASDESSENDVEDETSEEDEDDDEEYGVYTLETRNICPEEEVSKKVKTRGINLMDTESSSNTTADGEKQDNLQKNNWTQIQQKALESAIVQFSKGVTDRWDRIASKVQGKTKQQCMLRYKYLVEEVKRKKEASA